MYFVGKVKYMLNSIWPIFIIISVLYSFLFGNIETLSNSIFESIDNTVQVIIGLVGTMCFWNGIVNIAKSTSIMTKFEKLINPLVKRIFPTVRKDSPAYQNIALNITSNVLGLGNAATPLGLKAMEELKKENGGKNELSKEMKMFILINTASIQIIPTTVIAIRSSLGSKEPARMIIPVWIVSILVFCFVIFLGKKVFRSER